MYQRYFYTCLIYREALIYRETSNLEKDKIRIISFPNVENKCVKLNCVYTVHVYMGLFMYFLCNLYLYYHFLLHFFLTI